MEQTNTQAAKANTHPVTGSYQCLNSADFNAAILKGQSEKGDQQ